MITIRKSILKMSRSFNQDIVVPDGIRHVKMNRSFNSNIIFPDTVLIIEFGWSFNKDIILPPNLKTLVMQWAFNKVLVFPPSLIFLKLGRKFTQDILPNVKVLDISLCGHKKFIIPTLTHTVILHDYSYPKSILPITVQLIIFKYTTRKKDDLSMFKFHYGCNVIKAHYRICHYA